MNMNKLSNKILAGFAVLGSILAYASAASADVLTDSLTTVQTQVVGYATPIAATVVAVALAFVAVRLIPRVIRMVSARLG
jgi:hypothetical protein